MNWIKVVEDAIEYIEENITEDLTTGEIASQVNLSPFYCLYNGVKTLALRRNL